MYTLTNRILKIVHCYKVFKKESFAFYKVQCKKQPNNYDWHDLKTFKFDSRSARNHLRDVISENLLAKNVELYENECNIDDSLEQYKTIRFFIKDINYANLFKKLKNIRIFIISLKEIPLSKLTWTKPAQRDRQDDHESTNSEWNFHPENLPPAKKSEDDSIFENENKYNCACAFKGRVVFEQRVGSSQ